MARLNPYLQFDGNCREAMNFYKECLGGELWIQTFGEAPMAEGMPAEMRERILHAMLEGGGIVLMASDGMGGDAPSPGGPVTLCLNSLDKAEITAYYEKLTDGATINQPLKEEFFGLYGHLTDKFGINWMFQAGGEPGA
ncbi:MAG TPA: VOC family protein [Thermomicrobiales bacterium]|jgi:PhnB protein